MTTNRSEDHLVGLERELCKLPRETAWVGFKVNSCDPQEFGRAFRHRERSHGPALVTRYIREAVDAGMIKPFDEGAARKLMKYIPFWA